MKFTDGSDQKATTAIIAGSYGIFFNIFLADRRDGSGSEEASLYVPEQMKLVVRTTGRQTSDESDSIDSGWNLHYTELPTAALVPGREIVFTFMWKNSRRWEDVGVE